MYGAEGGLAGLAVGAGSMAGNALTRKYGKDALANTARGAERFASEMGQGNAGTRSAIIGAERVDEGERPRPLGSPHATTGLASRIHPSHLGQWAQELLEAEKKGSVEFAATLARLRRNDEFMRTVNPKLTAAIGGTEIE
jgi:hypothetical protein